MKIKTLSLFSAAVLFSLAPLCVSAAPLVSIGDNATVHFNGSASTYWTSNLFRDEINEVDDLVLTLTPGLELQYGNSATSLSVGGSVNYEIRSYDDRSDLDQNLLLINTYGSYQTSRLTVNAKAGYNEEQTNSDSVNNVLIESDNYNASIGAEYRLSTKFKFGAGYKYSNRDYVTETTSSADYTVYTIPLDLYYELTPKLDLSAGFTFSDREIEALDLSPVPGYDTQTYFYNVGLRGDLLPKLSGTAKVGYRNRVRDGFDDSGSLGVDLNFIWSTTPKLTNSLLLSRDIGTAGDGTTTEQTQVVISSSFSFTPQYYATTKLGYVFRDYQNTSNREDNQYEAGLSFNYAPNQYWLFSTGYTYVENDSNFLGRGYQADRISLSASLRY